MKESRASLVLSRWRVPLGFVMAVFYFFLARPTPHSILTGCAVALVGLLWRAWASGMIRKNQVLATDGPYAFSRNPLYLGSFLLAVGFGWASGNAWVLAAVIVLFLMIYWPVMRQEERELEGLFGERFEKYSGAVPFFWPWKGRALRAKEPRVFSWGQYWRNHEYNALLGFLAAMALLFLIKYWRGQ